MTIDRDLLAALKAPELKELLASVPSPNTSDLLKRDLLRRRSEIELELSSATAALDEAVAAKTVAHKKIALRLNITRHTTLFRVSALILAASIVATAIGAWLGWSSGKALLLSWDRPFSSGPLTASLWAITYFFVIITIFEGDFCLRRIPVLRRKLLLHENVSALEEAVAKADATRKRQLTKLVRDHVAEILNSTRGPIFRSWLQVPLGSSTQTKTDENVTFGIGLAEVFNEDNRVATDVQNRLVGLLAKLPGASLGISGPRGVGKSTLLAAMCRSNQTIGGRPAIAIFSSAPVEYDAREFLLHLFSLLCRQVLRTEGQERAIDIDRLSLLEAHQRRHSFLKAELPSAAKLLVLLGAALAGVALLLATLQSLTFDHVDTRTLAQAAAFSHTPKTKPLSNTIPVKGDSHLYPVSPTQGSAPNRLPSTPRIVSDAPSTASIVAVEPPAILHKLFSAPLFALGTTSIALGAILLFVYGPYRRIRLLVRMPLYQGEHVELVQEAFRQLRNINFQRTYTSGWSGALKIPAGLEMGSTDGLTLSQRPESLPELVERFRNFVTLVAATYDNVVLIGIDELDKLKSAQQAEAFLNGIKSVFGIQRCFYLVSVSEHALAAFERRGLGFRDVFDSALDDVIQLGFLNLEQSRLLLSRRILRLPDPFLQLCHMFSGGLPRDLIRHARALLECAADSPSGRLTLSDAVDQMAARDLTARLRATIIAVRTAREIAETNDLLSHIAALPPNTGTELAIAALVPFRHYIAGLAPLRESEEGRSVLRLAEELAVHYEMVCLLRRAAVLLSTEKGWARATESRLAEHVAGVRQALEVGVPLAEICLAELRKAIEHAASAGGQTTASTQ